MPGVLGIITYEPIKALKVLNAQGNSPAIFRVPEAATQTGNLGIPTMLDGSGNQVPWTTGSANIIYGITSEPFHNYASAGSIPSGGNQLLTDTPYSAATPPNQPNALITPPGSWPADGLMGVYAANNDTVFSIVMKLGQTFTESLMIAGTLYGLTKDATSGFWFLDNTVTSGNSAVASLLGMDSSSPNDGTNGTRVFFQVAAAKRYFQ